MTSFDRHHMKAVPRAKTVPAPGTNFNGALRMIFSVLTPDCLTSTDHRYIQSSLVLWFIMRRFLSPCRISSPVITILIPRNNSSKAWQ